MRPFIRDPIHENILLKELDISLINTATFQRLRRVKQTGTVYLVYPGANHTRFEHSIGVRHLAEKILDTLEIHGYAPPEDDKRVLLAASLLHDIAHTPFSHSLDVFDKEEHEKLSEKLIVGTEISDVLSSNGIEPREVPPLISGSRRPLSEIIRSQIDADRLDYLQRDAYYCGVAYGVVDSRILMEFRVVGDKLVISEKGVKPLESVLFARYSMYNMVYGHKTVRIASSMLTRGVLDAIERKELGLEELVHMGDEELISRLMEAGGLAAEMASRIRDRRLFKRAYSLPWDNAPSDLMKLALADRRSLAKRLEDEISKEAGLSVDEVIVDVPKLPLLEEADVKVVWGGRVEDFRRISLLAEPITGSLKRSWSIGVYCPKDHLEKVRAASSRILG